MGNVDAYRYVFHFTVNDFYIFSLQEYINPHKKVLKKNKYD